MALVVGCACFLLAAGTALGANLVYWSNANSHAISFANLDDTGDSGDLNVSGTTVADPHGVAIDPAANRIYWTELAGDANDHKISYANLDGSGGHDLDITGAGTVNEPEGLAIDPAINRIYWANHGDDSISFADIDGGHSENLKTAPGSVVGPTGIVIWPAKNKIYWGNEDGTIGYANLDDTGDGGVLSTGDAQDNRPAGLAIDPATDTLYWANQAGSTDDAGSISFLGLSPHGSRSGQIDEYGMATPPDTPLGVAIDPPDNKIYWANFGTKPEFNLHQIISFTNLDNTGGGGDLVTTPPPGEEGAVHSSHRFIALLKRPAGIGAPKVSGSHTVGSTLSCSEGRWAPDEPEEQLYQAPADFSYEWTRNGAQIAGADSDTLVASEPGEYVCRVTAGNHAGETAQASAGHTVSRVRPLGPDLALTHTASIDTVHPGDQLSYALVVRNRGRGEATRVTLEVLAPFAVGFEHVATSQGRCEISTDVTCDLGSLPAGGEALVKVTAQVAWDARLGPAVSRATVWDKRAEANETNNTASSTVEITAGPQNVGGSGPSVGGSGPSAVVQPVSDLVLSNQVDRAVARTGQRLTYTITVTNKGPDAATRVSLAVAHRLPTRVLSIRPGQGRCLLGPPLSCTLGTVRSGGRVTIRVVAVARVAGVQVSTGAVLSASSSPHPETSVATARTRILAASSRPQPAPPPPRVTG